MLTLISATPSPYARKNRIALLEKGIPFKLRTEIPWHSTTETPKYNPLEELPILIFDDCRSPIYESWFIQEYIVQKYKGTGLTLMPDSLDD
jgi:glutathione S-transferase